MFCKMGCSSHDLSNCRALAAPMMEQSAKHGKNYVIHGIVALNSTMPFSLLDNGLYSFILFRHRKQKADHCTIKKKTKTMHF